MCDCKYVCVNVSMYVSLCCTVEDWQNTVNQLTEKIKVILKKFKTY